VIDRGALMQRGWEAVVSNREANQLGTCPQTMVWLWDLAALARNNASVLQAYDVEQVEAWVCDQAAKESLLAAVFEVGRVLDICAELRTWDMDDLGVVNPSGELDKAARRHLCAVTRIALRAMAAAVSAAEFAPPGLAAMVRLAAAAEAVAAVEQVRAEADTGSFLDLLGERRRRAGDMFEAITVYLEGEGIAEPEDVARALIAAELRPRAPD
jgi:hypothetical protein